MFLWNLFLKFKFKYVISFICIITFYIFAFEKRYFRINSDWKVLCNENNNALCDFELKITNVESHKMKNLAIFSKYSSELNIIDIYNSSMTNDDVLSSPKVISKKIVNKFLLFDLKQNDSQHTLVGINQFGVLSYYVNFHLIFEKSIFPDKFINSESKFDYHSLDFLPKENLIFITGLLVNKESKERNPMVFCINGTNGLNNWQISLKDNEYFMKSNVNTNLNMSKSEIFTHWKLVLMQHHKNLDHIKQKASHINMEKYFPTDFSGKSKLQLSISQKTFKGFNKKQSEIDKIEGNYNSIIVQHILGLSLLDIHTGLVLAKEDIEWDLHSTYTFWPSNDHTEREGLFQLKLVSKLDHYSKDYMDINHSPDHSSTDSETHSHKIHCNLLFHKINPDTTSITPEANSWFVGHLCDPLSYMDYPRFSEKSWLEDPLKSVPPLITYDYATPAGLWGRLYHLIGRKLIDKNIRNAICISSDGLMTSLSSHGHQNWRTNAQVGWLHISRMVAMTPGSYIDSATNEIYQHHFRPSMTAVTLSFLNQTIRAVLSVGFDSISLTDLSDGFLLASHSLPCTPVDKPVVMATPYKGALVLSGDQVIVLICENMVIGFSIEHYIPWAYFSTLCLLMVAALLFLMWTLDPRNSYVRDLLA